MKKILKVQLGEEGERLDLFLSSKFPQRSRTYFYNLNKAGLVFVNEQILKTSYLVKAGDNIAINFPNQPKPTNLNPENIKLNIIFENENYLIIDKEPGMVVHPAAGNQSGTLINALLNYLPQIKEAVHDKNNLISNQRPGLVHRLDKDTSGLMIVAKNTVTMNYFSELIKNRKITKIYQALCYGWPKNPEGKLVNYIGRHPKNRKKMVEIGSEKGREAISFYKVLQHFKDKGNNKLSLIEFDIKTGRTHQIRVQSASVGHPIIGDSVYGNKQSLKISKQLGAKRQLLHAKELIFQTPDSQEIKKIASPLPIDFSTVLDHLSIES